MKWKAYRINKGPELTDLPTRVSSNHLFRGAVEIVTPEGERVWITTGPEVVKLIPEGAVYFLGDEIIQLQKADKESARAALMVKQVFPGATVIETTKL